MQKELSFAVVLMLSAVMILGSACSQPTPEERVATARARYEASINGFIVEQQPEEPTMFGEVEAAGEEPGEAAGAEKGAAEEEGEEGEGAEMAETTEMEMDEAPELTQNVLLDIVIRHDSPEKLDGITVDITMADGGEELEIWRVWLDTSNIEKGPGAQFSHTLQDVDYQPGYGFSAEIRHPVPPEDHHLYQEFAGLDG